MQARAAIIGLSVASAVVAEIIGALSLMRIANEHLGFPDYLEWTLTASVAVGAVAGAIMWSTGAEGSPIRRTGVRLNVSCSLICAVGVGLDHAVNATPERGWQIVAFLIGAFLPLLSTWLVHAIAKMRGTAAEERGRQTTTVSSGHEDTYEGAPAAAEDAEVPPAGIGTSDPGAVSVPDLAPTALHLASRPRSNGKPWTSRAQEFIRGGMKDSSAYTKARREWMKANPGRSA